MTTYTLFGQAAPGGTVTSGAGNAGTNGLHFTVSQSCTLQGIWHYSPSGSTQLPSSVGLYTTTASPSTGTLVTSNTATWLTGPGGSAASAGSGWVYAALTSPPSLMPGVDYMASQWRNDNVNEWFCYYPVTWPVTSGPLTAPDDVSTGQGWYNTGTPTAMTFPASRSPGINWGMDVQVSVVSLTDAPVTSESGAATAGVFNTVTSFSPAAGAMVLVRVVNLFATSTSPAATFSVRDSHGNAYASPVQGQNGYNVAGAGIFYYIYPSAPGATTLTITSSNTTTALELLVSPTVITGQASGPIGPNVINTSTSGTTTALTPSLVTTQAGSLVYLAGGVTSGSTMTAAANTSTVATYSGYNNAATGISSGATTTPGSTMFGWSISPTSTYGGDLVAVEVLPAGTGGASGASIPAPAAVNVAAFAFTPPAAAPTGPLPPPTPRDWVAQYNPSYLDLNTCIRDTFNFLAGPPRLRVAANAAQGGLTAQSWTVIQLQSVIEDTYSGWTGGSGNFYTAKVPGWYGITYSARVAIPAGNTGAAGLRFSIGGIVIGPFEYDSNEAGVSPWGFDCYDEVYLHAGDTVTPTFIHQYASAVSTATDFPSSLEIVWLSL